MERILRNYTQNQQQRTKKIGFYDKWKYISGAVYGELQIARAFVEYYISY